MRLLVLADGRNVARWNDPATGKLRQETLDKLGLTNADERRRWAVGKSGDLRALRLAASLATSTPEPITVAEALIEYGKAKPVAARTASARKIPLDDFARYCKERGLHQLDALTAPRLWPWRDGVVADVSRMESTRNLMLASVAAFLRWAKRRDYLPLLASDKIAAMTARIDEPARQIEFLRPAQLRAVFEAAVASDALGIRQRRQVGPFLLAMFLTGMRFAEIAGLDWSECHVSQGEIRLPAARTKGRRARTVSLAETPALAELLQALHERAGKPASGLVFAPRWHPQVTRDHFARLGETAGVACGPHTMRRSAGTYLACAPGVFGGASAFLAAKRLGHGVAIAEKHYAGALSGLPADARTLEAAAGIADLAAAIVASVGGVVPAEAEAVAQ